MLAPNRIEWNGYSSLDFNLITQLAFESGDSGETNTFLTKNAVVSETYNNQIKRGSSYKWGEEFTPRITFMKSDFGDFSPDENRRILSWLSGKQTPGFLTLYEDDTKVITCEILGNFTSISQYKLGNGRVVGYMADFTSLLPYPLSSVKTYPTDTTEPQVITEPITITVKCLTDEPEVFVYPKITITQNNSVVVTADSVLGSTFQHGKAAPDGYVPGTVYLYNNLYYWVGADGLMIGSSTNTSGLDTTSVVFENITTGTRTVVGGNVVGETVTIDGANKVISSSRPTGRIFGDNFNFRWLPLKYEDNQIKITGNCSVKFEFRYPLKTGDFIGKGTC